MKFVPNIVISVRSSDVIMAAKNRKYLLSLELRNEDKNSEFLMANLLFSVTLEKLVLEMMQLRQRPTVRNGKLKTKNLREIL